MTSKTVLLKGTQQDGFIAALLQRLWAAPNASIPHTPVAGSPSTAAAASFRANISEYENMKQLCFTAFDHGITHFDLANNCGPTPGSAERNLGRILREELGAYRDELVISTKAGYEMWDGPYGNWGSRKHNLASLDQSLQRMGCLLYTSCR